MTNLELVKDLEPKLVSTNKENIEIGEKYLVQMLDYLETKNIKFNQDSIIGLGSHVFGTIGRIKNNEKMMDFEDDFFSEIKPEVYEYAKEAAKIIEDGEHIALTKSEVLLIAIHIQNTIDNF